MPTKKKRELPEAFIKNSERMKAGEIKRKAKPKAAKKTTRKPTKGRR